jgi:hypothetical protein
MDAVIVATRKSNRLNEGPAKKAWVDSDSAALFRLLGSQLEAVAHTCMDISVVMEG